MARENRRGHVATDGKPDGMRAIVSAFSAKRLVLARSSRTSLRAKVAGNHGKTRQPLDEVG